MYRKRWMDEGSDFLPERIIREFFLPDILMRFFRSRQSAENDIPLSISMNVPENGQSIQPESLSVFAKVYAILCRVLSMIFV